MDDQIKITCDDIKGKLKSFLEDLLTEGEYKAFNDHIKTCDKCRTHVRSIGSLSNHLWKLGKVKVPEDLSSTIAYKFSHSGEKSQPFRSVIPKKYIAAGFILILLAAAIFFGINRFKDRQTGNEIDITPIVSTEIVQTPTLPSNEESRFFLKSPEVITIGLNVFEKGRAAEEVSTKEGVLDEGTSIRKRSPDREGKIADPKVIPLHWHFQYSKKINEAELKARRQSIRQLKERVKEKSDEIEGKIRVLEEEKEKAQIKLGQRYSDKLKATKLAEERQIELKLQQMAEEKKQLEDAIESLEEGKRQLEFNQQQGLKEGRRQRAVHKTKVLNVLNIFGIMQDYKDDNLFVFSISGEKMEDVREQILFTSQGISSFRDFTDDAAILPHKEYHVSMYFKKEGIPALHWHINSIAPDQKSYLSSIIEKKSTSIDHESDRLIVFSLQRVEVKKLRTQARAMGAGFFEFGYAEFKESQLSGISGGPVKISIYLTEK